MSASSASASAPPAPIIIVGGGLAGCMAALLLARQYAAQGNPHQRLLLLEHRADFRVEERLDAEGGRMANSIKRSINLALSHRGISALEAAGLSADSGEIIPMRARLMHSLTGAITAQPYGEGEQAIYSISRRDLNELLLNELDKLPNVDIIFNAKVQSVDQNGVVVYGTLPNGPGGAVQSHTLHSLFVIGADGAYSRVRESMRRFTRMDFQMSYIKHGYKELTIPPRVLADGRTEYAMDPWQGLHIWPRDQFMLIALPNPDRSFTCTLFFPFTGPESLEAVKTDEDIIAYFERYFPDVIPLMPDLISDFRASPSSSLLQIKCEPYHSEGSRVMILGDAAHAVVPFYGQGMNAAFEDCLILSEIMAEFNMDYQRALPEFTARRAKSTQALADLSYQNYIEMRHHTGSALFLLRKKVEAFIHRVYPAWIPQYTMVAFTRIPYDEAVTRAKRQDRIIQIGTWIAIGGVAITALAVGRLLVSAANGKKSRTATTVIAPTPKGYPQAIIEDVSKRATDLYKSAYAWTLGGKK